MLKDIKHFIFSRETKGINGLKQYVGGSEGWGLVVLVVRWVRVREGFGLVPCSWALFWSLC